MTIQLTEVDFRTVEEHAAAGQWPLDWTSVRGLIPYINQLPDNVVGVEIGTCRGESSTLILEQCVNVKKLYAVDPFMEYDDWAGKLNQDTMSKFEKIAHENLNKFDDRSEIIKSRSDNISVLNRFEENSLDFIFVDGDHSFDATLKDIVNWYPKLRSGGIFSGHDYNLTDVREAVKTYMMYHNVRVPIQQTLNNVWFWYKS
jgi:predicted O-methyltransferase YrrM